MPDDHYPLKEGNNHISVVRTNMTQSSSSLSTTTITPSTVASSPSTSSSEFKHEHSGSKTGMIAGAAVGGAAAIMIIILLTCFFVQRRRKRTPKEGGKLSRTSIFPGAVEKKAPQGGIFALHRTSKEARFLHKDSRTSQDKPTLREIGFHRKDQNVPGEETTDKTTNAAAATVCDISKGYIRDCSKADYYMSQPASVTTTITTTARPKLENSEPAVLDSHPIPAHGSSQMSEMPDTSSAAIKNQNPSSPASCPVASAHESPHLGRASAAASGGSGSGSGGTLERNAVRKQHIMSWNNYDDAAAMARPEAMSAGLLPTAERCSRVGDDDDDDDDGGEAKSTVEHWSIDAGG